MTPPDTMTVAASEHHFRELEPFFFVMADPFHTPNPAAPFEGCSAHVRFDYDFDASAWKEQLWIVAGRQTKDRKRLVRYWPMRSIGMDRDDLPEWVPEAAREFFAAHQKPQSQLVMQVL